MNELNKKEELCEYCLSNLDAGSCTNPDCSGYELNSEDFDSHEDFEAWLESTY